MKRDAAAAWIEWPPSTDPVNATNPMRGSAIIEAIAAWSAWMCWNTPSGSPAASKAAEYRSAHRIVCVACLRITVLPDSSAGAIELIDVR
jgi:hypothetical protein